MIFCHFHHLALVTFFLIGAFKGSDHLMYGDLISATYIFLSIGFIIKSREVLKKRHAIL